MIEWRSWLTRRLTANGIAVRLARRGVDPVVDLLWEHAGGALVAVDRLGRVDAVNDAARAMLAGAVERHDPVLKLFAEKARDDLWTEITAAIPGEPQRVPVRMALAAGTIVAVTVRALPSRDAVATGVLLRLDDLSRERELETLRAQTRQLRALVEFSGGVAHDFNNLLAAILGAAEAIAGQEGVPIEVTEDAAQIRASAERGTRLVRQMLTSGGEAAVQLRRVAVPAAITGLSSMLRRLLGRTIRFEVAVDADAADQEVMVDPVQLDRVLVNLAANARDAMPMGGELRIESRPVTLQQSRATRGGPVPAGRWVTIDVCDSGVGMAPETLSRVLEPYFTTRREQGGTGLGLSTVHAIVRHAGGLLAIESTPGVGTRIRIWLPACDRAAPPPALLVASAPLTTASATTTPATTARTVLLVDDEEPVRRLAERALTRQGWRVLAADSAEAALATLDAEPAGSAPLAAMVSDVVMPGLDGAALVDLIRARVGQAALPALLVSGYSDVSLRAVLADRPATGFLPKPYSLGELVSRVAALAGPPRMP